MLWENTCLFALSLVYVSAVVFRELVLETSVSSWNTMFQFLNVPSTLFCFSGCMTMFRVSNAK